MNKYEGEVKWFDNSRGYGFIYMVRPGNVIEKGTEYFVHFSSIISEGFKTLEEGQRVSFNLRETSRGTQAADVESLM